MQHQYLKPFLILLVCYGVAVMWASTHDNLRNQLPAESAFTGVPAWTEIDAGGVAGSPDPGGAEHLSNYVDEYQQVSGPDSDKRKLQIVDLAGIVNRIMRTESDKYDYSLTLLGDKNASVHLHVLGYAQTTPLHLHHTSEEATIIVAGKPHVTQYFGRNGKVEKLEGDYGPGTMIYSPHLCGHKWVNTSKKTMQANLVIASPPFLGNFYVDSTDPLFKTSEPASIVRPEEDLQRWLRVSQSPAQAEKLPMMNGKMLRLLLRKQIHFPPSPSATILYIISGKGLLVVGQKYPLAAQHLAMIPPQFDITLEASQNAPLSAIAFRPEAGWEPPSTQ